MSHRFQETQCRLLKVSCQFAQVHSQNYHQRFGQVSETTGHLQQLARCDND